MYAIPTIDGSHATIIDRHTSVELIYKGELRTGTVERGDHPAVLTLKTDKGFRSFSRPQIERLAFIL